MNLPMPVRRVVSAEQVKADRGRIALQRGPVVYCVEWPEVAGGHVRNLMLSDNAPLTAEYKSDMLKGVEVIHARGQSLAQDADGKIVSQEKNVTAIPYYAWANRGRGEMAVWLPNSEATAKPLPYPHYRLDKPGANFGRAEPARHQRPGRAESVRR